MTPKQRKFSVGYAKSQNVYKSAKEAGYSDHYARTKAKILLGNAEITAEIRRIRDRLNQQADKSATDVVNEYSKIAFADRTSFLKDDPDFPGHRMYKSPQELTQEQRDIVERVTPQWYTRKRNINGQVVEIHRQEFRYVIADKANALQQMGRHFGIFDDKLKLGVSRVNPFTNATQAQLEQLKKSWIETMNDPKLIEGEFEEVPSGK